MSIRHLARLAARLSPERGDPERFYLNREAVVVGLLQVAAELEACP